MKMKYMRGLEATNLTTNDGAMVKRMRFAVYVKSKSSMHTAGHLNPRLHGGLTNSSTTMDRSTTACGACGCVCVDVVHAAVLFAHVISRS